MRISEYLVLIESRTHGVISYTTWASSEEMAVFAVIEAEGCPLSCVKSVRRIRELK